MGKDRTEPLSRMELVRGQNFCGRQVRFQTHRDRSGKQNLYHLLCALMLWEHLPKLLINRSAENNSMMHVVDEHLLDLAANRVRTLSQVTN